MATASATAKHGPAGRRALRRSRRTTWNDSRSKTPTYGACLTTLLAAFVQRNHWNIRPDAVKSLSPDAFSTSATLITRPAPTNEPLVTLAIAHYNLGRYLPDTLATLATQTYTSLEVIVIDDGSAGSRHRSKCLRRCRSSILRGSSFGRRTRGSARHGIGVSELARGDFFIPVDADNLARPDMVAKFVTAMQLNPRSLRNELLLPRVRHRRAKLAAGKLPLRASACTVDRTRSPASATSTATRMQSSVPPALRSDRRLQRQTAERRARTGSVS